jgi:two-component system phosphate regulon sensor histidine kinase PhoR
MKKKLIWTAILSVFFSLLSLLAISVFLVAHYGKEDAERSLKNYLAVAEGFYDADNADYGPEATKKLLQNSYSDVRLTIISDTDPTKGDVLIDTENDVTSNHLLRPEIQHPGTIVYRYSDTLKERRVYLADIDEGSKGTLAYVRVSFSVASVEKSAYSLAGYGALGILVITALSGLLTAWITRRSLMPLQEQVNRLSAVVGEPATPQADVKELSERIEKAQRLLDERYAQLQQEKTKYEALLDGMDQGLVALDSQGNAQIVNAAGAAVFQTSKDKALGQSYRFFSTEAAYLSGVEAALQGHSSANDLVLGAKTYNLIYMPLAEGFAEEKGRYGVAILSMDVTEKRKLDAAKRDFFANASHELKSPLTAIIGYQELVENGTLSSPDERLDATERTLKEARRMKEIILSMLALAKLEGGAPKKIAQVSLKKVIESVLADYQIEIQKKRLVVALDLQETVVAMDPEDAKNLVHNLIENGIRYNKEGGSLTITLKDGWFRVKDTGIGIAKENQARVFERFYRVDIARSKEAGGTGLGLSIVKHICLDYGFPLSLTSELGLGSTFSVQLVGTH